MFYLLLALFLPIKISYADGIKEEEKVQVRVNENTYSIKEFPQNPIGDVKAMKGKEKSKERVLPAEERNALFSQIAGLNKQIQSMDELDKDLLLIDAKSKSLSALRKSYPRIPKQILKDLQKIIKK